MNNLCKHLLHAVALCLRDIHTGMDKAAAVQDARSLVELIVLEGFFLAIGDRLMAATNWKAQPNAAQAPQAPQEKVQ